MICKKDVVLWFKELESYKRIDTMCTLLNMCLPFELRFLGTCLEELGRRDSQELRGIELRVNNAGDLAADMVACQKGEPTDKKIRRKMALYLALIRACNKTCVTEIFRTLDGWGDRDFQSMTDVDTLQELLLVYTMAAHHPVFSFDQHMKCNEIFERIKENKLVNDETNLQQQTQQPTTTTQTLSFNEQTGTMGVGVLPTPQNIELLQQQQSNIYPHLIAAPIQMLPQGSMPMNFPHLTKLMPSADGSMQHQITLDGIPHMISSNISIPTDVLPHPNATWALRPYPPPPTQLPLSAGSSSNTSTSMEPPPQASSPMLSQQSSPASSRAASPNRLQQTQQQQQQIRNMSQRIQGAGGSLKHVRRPSMETTPPPMIHTNIDMILPPNMKHIDDAALSNDGNSANQLQTLIRNGFNRSTHHPRMKSGQYMPTTMHQQQQQQQQQQQIMNQQQQQNFQGGGFQTLSYAMQNMSIDGNCSPQTHVLIDGSAVGVGNMLPGMNSNRSAGSDSGSSLGSSGDLSPPGTPTILQQQQQQQHKHQFVKGMNLSRINGGRGDKGGGNNVNNNNNNNNNNSNTSATILYAGTPQLYTASGTGDIILAPTGSSPVATAASSVSGNPSSASNNNAATVLMPSYNTNYPYHALANNSGIRPPLMGQPNLGAPPPPNSFRLPGGFQLPPPPPPNGELIYPAYHPAGGIAFLSSAVPPPPVTLRSGNAPNAPTLQTAPGQGVSPYALASGSVNKPLSCYNCGSQTHSGRDCQSPSMDDATRGAVYKLDYSVAAQQNPPAGSTVVVGTPINSPTGSQLDVKQQQIIDTPTPTVTPSGTSGGTTGGVSNVKSM